MFFKIFALFSIFQLIFAANSTNGYNSTDHEVLAANIYDDSELLKIQEKLDLLQTMNVNLRIKIDSLEMTLSQQRNELKNDLKELKATLITQKESIELRDLGKANLADIRLELNQQLTMQRNELKKDLEELKAVFTIQKESIESRGSGKENHTDICLEINQQLTMQRNELKKDLEELKAVFTIQKESIESRGSGKENHTDICLEINQQLTMQRNESKKDFKELKAALTIQKESIKSIDSGNSNLIENQNSDQSKNITKSLTTMQSLPTSCAEALKASGDNGIYKIQLPHSGLEPFDVYCLKDIADMSENHIKDTNSTNYNSAWLVIQRRQDGTVDFNRSWSDYQHGFGNLEGEFFIGLDKLHALTQSVLHELWIQLEDFEGLKRWAKYNIFSIGGENELYALKILGEYTGDAGDSLRYHKNKKWSTFDRNNDLNPIQNCAGKFAAGWWFNNDYIICLVSNLNGQYLREDVPIEGGIHWYHWHGDNYSLKYAHMAIRPVQ